MRERGNRWMKLERLRNYIFRMRQQLLNTLAPSNATAKNDTEADAGSSNLTATDSSTEGGQNASIDDGSTSFRATKAITKQESYDAENNASNASNASIASNETNSGNATLLKEAPATFEHAKSAAVVFFGDSYDVTTYASRSKAAHYIIDFRFSSSSFNASIFAPLHAAGYTTDVFISTNNVQPASIRTELLEKYRPVKYEFKDQLQLDAKNVPGTNA